jgi:ParB family transcriptional regulator, chromosome partitioning protein
MTTTRTKTTRATSTKPAKAAAGKTTSAPRASTRTPRTAAAEKPAMRAASRTTSGGGRTSPAAPPAASTLPPAVQLLPLTALDDHPDNPAGRSQPDPDLVASIRSVGVLQPLVVTPADQGRWTIVAGHRRRAAAAAAGLTDVLCVVRDDLDRADVDVAMAVENGRRRGLSALEEAAVYARLRDRDGLSQRAIAERVGVNQSQVSRLLSLLKLPDTARAAVALEQVAVADAAQLAQYTSEPEAFARGWEELTHGYRGVKVAVQVAQSYVDAQRLRAKLRAAGEPLADRAPTYDGTPRIGHYVPVSHSEHAKLDCHVVHVDDWARETWGCTDPKAHGASRPAAGGHAAKEREDARERTKAMKARTAAAQTLEAWPVAPADAVRRLTTAVLRHEGHSDALKLVHTWWTGSGVPQAREAGTDRYALERAVKASGDEQLLTRLALAMALAFVELRARYPHGRWDRDVALYLHDLAMRAQYEPTAWERERLRTHVGILDVEAFLRTPDPSAHLPEQPTLHSALGTEPATDLGDDEQVVDLDQHDRPVETLQLTGTAL